MERFCRECGTPLSGRSDKQFCCDDCRISYHNRLYYSNKKPTREVNRILSYNRSLLARLHRSGVKSISLSDERLMGYNCRYFTSVEHRPLRPARYHCYEFSYSLVRGRLCMIRKAGGSRESL